MPVHENKCSGARCPMQYNTINVDECTCGKECLYFTPKINDDLFKKAILYMAAFPFYENNGNENGDGNLNMQENKA